MYWVSERQHSITQQANQKHELEIDRAATIDICRVTFIADEPT
jgi:hypothetical protein